MPISNTARTTARRILKLYRGDETRWTKMMYAKDRAGNEVSPESRKAVCWCLMGAIDKVSRGLMDDLQDTMQEAFIEVTGRTIMSFNDNRQRHFPEIVKALTKIAESK